MLPNSPSNNPDYRWSSVAARNIAAVAAAGSTHPVEDPAGSSRLGEDPAGVHRNPAAGSEVAVEGRNLWRPGRCHRREERSTWPCCPSLEADRLADCN